MLKRKAYDQIAHWKENKTTQALLISGVRQSGKTYLIREFAKSNYDSVVEINLLENTEAQTSFNAATNSKDLFARISVEAESKLIPGKTLIFIDEVQKAKEVVTFIKFLVQREDYDYILSGSMLGVELKNIRSVPVGYLHEIQMYPLDFEEYCWANGLNWEPFERMKQHFWEITPVEDFLHERLLTLFHEYLIVGGMPQAVSQYVETSNIQYMRTIQQNIVNFYRADITQYAETKNAATIKRIFDLIPAELNRQSKRFLIKDIDGKMKFERSENHFLWLVDANVALATYNVSESRHPLLLYMASNYFKLFLSDVGLLTGMCGIDVVRDIKNDRVDINFGSLYENVVAQELVAHGFKPYYFRNKKMGELDFIIEQKDGRVIPLEVKSGKNYKRHVALSKVLEVENYQLETAYVLHEGNVSQNDKVCYLPIYMVCCFSPSSELTKPS